MSMVRCDECNRAIDSDDDPECFVPGEVTATSIDRVYCQSCRERLKVGDCAEELDPCTCSWGVDQTCGERIIKRKDRYCPQHGNADPDMERDAKIDREMERQERDDIPDYD